MFGFAAFGQVAFGQGLSTGIGMNVVDAFSAYIETIDAVSAIADSFDGVSSFTEAIELPETEVL